jgi:hypothetical protein
MRIFCLFLFDSILLKKKEENGNITTFTSILAVAAVFPFVQPSVRKAD